MCTSHRLLPFCKAVKMALAARSTARQGGLRQHAAARPAVRLARPLPRPVRAVELDLSDPDTQFSLAGVIFGLVVGIGAPIWYINRTERDEERLEELRAMNRATFEATGQYMTDVSACRLRGAELRGRGCVVPGVSCLRSSPHGCVWLCGCRMRLPRFASQSGPTAGEQADRVHGPHKAWDRCTAPRVPRRPTQKYHPPSRHTMEAACAEECSAAARAVQWEGQGSSAKLRCEARSS